MVRIIAAVLAIQPTCVKAGHLTSVVTFSDLTYSVLSALRTLLQSHTLIGMAPLVGSR